MWLTDLFRRETTDAARRERMEELERALTQSLRQLASTFSALANHIEQRRLSRAGYEKQERFLTRADPSDGPEKK